MRFHNYINEAALKGWNEYVKSIPMLKSAIKVLQKIEKKGYGAWVVGE